MTAILLQPPVSLRSLLDADEVDAEHFLRSILTHGIPQNQLHFYRRMIRKIDMRVVLYFNNYRQDTSSHRMYFEWSKGWY
jgi:hypothetical protein